MQCAKDMISIGCQGSAVVPMQGEGSLRVGTGHDVRAVACACHSGTPPPNLHKNHPRNPPGTPLLHRNPPPPSCIGTIPGTPQELPSCTGTPPPFVHRNPPS